MARFTAPADISGADLNAGPFAVADGILEVPDDALTDGDRFGLAMNGFVPAPDPTPAKGKAGKPAPDPTPSEPAPEGTS